MDGIPDFVDVDDDNDGVKDSLEQDCGLSQTWSGSGGCRKRIFRLGQRLGSPLLVWQHHPISNFAETASMLPIYRIMNLYLTQVNQACNFK